MTKVFSTAARRSWPWLGGIATLLLAVGTSAVSCGLQPVTARLTVNPLVRAQVMTGWEAVAQAGQGTAGFASIQRELFDVAVGDLGINRIRLEVRSGLEHSSDKWSQRQSGAISQDDWRAARYATINDNSDPFSIEWSGFQFAELDDTVRSVVRPIRDRLAARGESLFVNATYVAFTRDIRTGEAYAHEDPEEYAEFVLATYLHLQATFGWVPDGWNVILEPDNTDFWRGATIGRAVAAAGRRLRQHGFTPRFTAPSTTNMANAPRFFDAAIDVPGAREYIAELSYHRYHGVSEEALRQIADRGERYGVQTAMLEHIGSGYEDLHTDLTRGRVSAWEQYALAYPGRDDGSKYYTIQPNAGGQSRVTMAGDARYLRQYFHHVRRGATRIGATSTDTRLDPVAFVNADGRTVVVIRATGAGHVAIAGLPAGRYGASHATRDGSAESPETRVAAGAELEASIPGRGVLTVYAH
jgi:hypothetical protein